MHLVDVLGALAHVDSRTRCIPKVSTVIPSSASRSHRRLRVLPARAWCIDMPKICGFNRKRA